MKSVTVNLSGAWAVCCLFTIGLCKLGFWQAVLALLIWPYYLGDFARSQLS